jgi:hypothetical protein
MDCAPTHPAPANSKMDALGPPVTAGHKAIRVQESTVRGRITSSRGPRIQQAIAPTPHLPATTHGDGWAITAIADKTPELAKTLPVKSAGETRGKDTYFLGPPVRAPTLTDEANGAASRGTIGNALHPTPNLHRGRTAVTTTAVTVTTTAVTTRETVSHRIGSLGYHLRRARSGESTTSPSAAWPAVPAGHPQSRSN